MALIKYIGTAHYRQLLISDFEKAGVKVDQAITFAKDEVVEVSADVAKALDELVADEFEKVKASDVDKKDVRKASDQPAPAEVGAAQSEWVQRTNEGEQPNQPA